MVVSMPFTDRQDAGRQLANRLAMENHKDAVVIALPRGGLPVAAEIAKSLGLPLDIALVRKVGVPGQPELALGAVSLDGTMETTVNDDIVRVLRLSDAEVHALAQRELPELERRQRLYRGAAPAIPVSGKTIVLVDDGVATGATMRSAIRLLRKRGAARIVLALPVAPADALAELGGEADETICLATPDPFGAVGAHYADFRQVSDAEVARILDDARNAAADAFPGTA
jgi:putative phosphoribosyl transferase